MRGLLQRRLKSPPRRRRAGAIKRGSNWMRALPARPYPGNQRSGSGARIYGPRTASSSAICKVCSSEGSSRHHGDAEPMRSNAAAIVSEHCPPPARYPGNTEAVRGLGSMAHEPRHLAQYVRYAPTKAQVATTATQSRCDQRRQRFAAGRARPPVYIERSQNQGGLFIDFL